eukprot:scaffold43883_cov65-Phaeocystis_antarctica.AAC.4
MACSKLGGLCDPTLHRPPNNTLLNTRQQRTQVQGHISHTRARADRHVPQILRVRSGRGRHSATPPNTNPQTIEPP